MWKDAYLETEVLTADPVELVRILYRAAIDSVRYARVHLAKGEIRERANCINRAMTALGELYASLDQNAAGEMGQNLASLYVYIRQRLTEANVRQADSPMAEAENLLTILYEAWEPPQPVHPAAHPAPKLVAEWEETAMPELHSWCA
jgi:flagellar secretion chaperone FliS